MTSSSQAQGKEGESDYWQQDELVAKHKKFVWTVRFNLSPEAMEEFGIQPHGAAACRGLQPPQKRPGLGAGVFPAFWASLTVDTYNIPVEEVWVALGDILREKYSEK